MAKYLVRGKLTLSCDVTVEAENKEEAIEKAYDKIVSVRNTDKAEARISVYQNGDIEYDEAELIEE